MRPSLRVVLALIMALTAVAAPAAQAQGPDIRINIVVPPPPSGAANYGYWDDEGWGYMTVWSHGSAWPYTGPELISVRIVQNGRVFPGSGVRYGNRFFFTVSGSYFIQAPTYGWGSYHILGSPSQEYRCWIQ